MGSKVNFLNMGFSGCKMLIHLGGSGIKILFSKWSEHLEQVLLKHSSATMSRIKRISPGIRLPIFVQGASDTSEQTWTAVDWMDHVQQTAIREYFGLSEHQRITILFYKLQKLLLNQDAWMFSLQKTSQGHFLEDCYQKRRE